MRASYTRKRAGVLAEIAAAANAVEERRKIAERSFKAYGEAYPNHVDGNKIERPSFFEWLFSFGRSSRMYNAAARAAQDVVQAQATYRRRQRWEEELENWLRRSIHRVTVEYKQRTEAPDWLEKFHARPEVAELFAKVQAIKGEREEYAGRVQGGDVPPLEQRARYTAENKIQPLRPPFDQMMISDIAQFGDLFCWMFADLQGNKFWLPYDRRLEPLIDSVFDTYRLVDDLKAKFNRSEDGRRFTPLDHYLRRLRDETDARIEWRQRTTTLRAQKDVAKDSPIDDPDDRKILDLLASLATTSPAPAAQDAG
ncbi:MAG: hypothetical protein JO359_09140 [Candidatus Eremiobacteraeota bacterium]|nr:hypothetical protein [Candidatus Eremiobacteraeota bacterium]